MTEDNCRVPLRLYLPVGDEQKTGKNHRYFIISAGVLLIVTVTILIGITFLLMHEINELKSEVDELQISVSELKKGRSFPVNDEFNDDTQTDRKNNPDVFFDYETYDDDNDKSFSVDDKIFSDDDDDNNYSDDYYDDDEDDDLINDIHSDNTNILLTGEQFTKDLKDFKDNNREKRNVVGYTQDGVPINSESFAEATRKNQSQLPRPHHRPGRRQHRVILQEGGPKPLRHVVRKSSLKSGDYRNSQEDSETEFTIIRTPERPRTVETVETVEPRYHHPHRTIGRMRPLPATHYDGDTSKYDPNLHPHYNGNGHLRHPHGTYTDWTESGWVRSLGMDKHFGMEKGVVSIKDPGVYFVYAQIYHLDEHDTSGFKIYKNDDVLIQCTGTAHSVRRELKGNTCYTAAASYLEKGDLISLKDLSESHYSLFAPGMSFFGLIKLGDVQINNNK